MTNPVVILVGLVFAGAGFVALYQYTDYTAEQRERVPVLSRLFVAAVVLVVAAGLGVANEAWSEGTYRNLFLGAAIGCSAVAVALEWGIRRRLEIGSSGGEATAE